MKIDFTVKKNVEAGVKVFKKPEDQKGNQRITFKLTKKQRSILFAYCEENGLSVSEIVRTSLQDYFEKVGYSPQVDQVDDDKQMKMF